MARHPTAALSSDATGPPNPNSFAPAELDALARSLRTLMLFPKTWIHRRVHDVELTDHASACSRISVDFTLPAGLPIEERKRIIVPLGFLGRDPLERFDLRDEAERTIPLITLAQSHELGYRSVVGLAEATLRGRRKESSGDATLLHPRNDAAFRLAFALEPSPRQASEPAESVAEVDHAQRQLAELRAVPALQSLISNFVSQFPILAGVAYEPGRRRVLKYAYEVHLQAGRKQASTGTRRSRADIAFMFADVSFTNSFHMTVRAPKELVFQEVKVLVAPPAMSSQLRKPPGDDTRVITRDVRAVPSGGWLTVLANLQLDPVGLASAVVELSGGITAVLLAGCALHLAGLNASETGVTAAVAVAAAVPGIFAAFLVPEAGKPLIERFAGTARRILFIVGVAPVVAAVSLGIPFPRALSRDVAGVHFTPHFDIWVALTLLTGVLTAWTASRWRVRLWRRSGSPP